MGFLSRTSTVVSPTRMRAGRWDEFDDHWYAPNEWVNSLAAAGITVTPDLAMTLGAYYSGVTTIGYDLATLPLQVFKYRADGGKDRVRGGSFAADTGGISGLVYKLRWQPNNYQTASELILNCMAQFLLRSRCFVELTTDGLNGFLDQMLPRHPDRVKQEMLPSGRVRFKLTEPNGGFRYLTQDEMLCVRDLSITGLDGTSRTEFAANALGVALAAERAAGKFFRSGMMSGTVATYKGEMDEDEESALHKSITRFATGVENNFGLMLIPDDVTVANLGIEPEKAQMMLAREWGVREVARILRLPGYKLGIPGATAYASQVQAALDYVVSCLRPIAVFFEQAFQRDLILAKDTYFVEFKLEALMRGDPAARAAIYESGIRSRWMRPSEARLLENMNPDPALDKLSEQDFKPGQAGQKMTPSDPVNPGNTGTKDLIHVKGLLAVHDNAVRVLRRERIAVEKLAKKHASDPDGWQDGLRHFFEAHATFVSDTMRLHPTVARGYAAQHGSELALKGLKIYGAAGQHEEWERAEADDLTALALTDGSAADSWFTARHNRLIELESPE